MRFLVNKTLKMMIKKILLLVPIFGFLACGDDKNSTENIELETFEQRLSYGLGADYGTNFLNMPEEYLSIMDFDALEVGFYNGITAAEHDEQSCQNMLEAAFSSPNGIDTSLYDMSLVSNCYGYVFGEMLRKNMESKNAFDKIIPDHAKIGFRLALKETDTLIDLQERAKMIADFNNDMIKALGDEMIEKAKDIPNSKVLENGVVLVENAEAPSNEIIQREMEYEIVFTMTNAKGDTLYSTNRDESKTPEENAQTLNADEMIFPDGWSLSAEDMKVGGDYTLYIPYDLAYGERGLMNPNQNNYLIPPFSAIIIHSKVLSQGEMHSGAKARGAKIMAEAKKKPNAKVGKSGYVLEVLEEGKGENVPPGSDVKAHYILTNSSGKEVENSYLGAAQGRGVPAFSLNGVIKGWQDAVPEMRKGGKYKLYLPYDLAYGEGGSRSILPYETLTFEMEIVEFGQPGSLTQQ
jgi:FKBP-type peptidyl-prolyl cis-trans isomerase